jgi:hypothetical protein
MLDSYIIKFRCVLNFDQFAHGMISACGGVSK